MSSADQEGGKVFLVGAGPGDPGLVTVRGVECLRSCDVVVYDRLANERLLDHVPQHAERLYVGKEASAHSVPQSGINALIVARAREGKTVCRLKGGDPFIFGRGGEEAEELVAAGVAFEVVPGVTAAVAAAAYAGIPLTHRDYASSVAFVTGHEDPTKVGSSINWAQLATGVDTLVFYMGVGNLPLIAGELMANGRSGSTPAAVIRWGTLPRQETVTAPLDSIAEVAKGVKPPALIVVGEVVRLRERLRWFDTRPLFGKRVVVTRSRDQASGLVRRLEEHGAEAIEFPVIEIVGPDSYAPLDAAIANLADYDWVLFTSVNGVAHFYCRLDFHGKDSRALCGAKVAALGPKTAEALLAHGVRADYLPGKFTSEAVAAEFPEPVSGSRVLIPRAQEAPELLPERLREAGATVDVVPCYKTVVGSGKAEELRQRFTEGQVDVVTFTSSSTVSNFLQLMGREVLTGSAKPVLVACIGPVTSDTARKQGLIVDLEAKEHTIEGLIQGLIEHFA